MSFAFVFAFSLSAHAVSNAGSTGASFLELGVGARAGALGEANTAWADDVYGMYFNPAGIARIRRQELGLFHNTLFADLSYNYIGYVSPLSRSSAIGATVLYVDLGSIDRTTISSGQANTVLGRANGSDVMGSLTYSRALTRYLDIGATLKVINEKLDKFSATAGAIDLGLKWHQPLQGLTLGLSLSNLGTRLQFVRESEELPITLRLGAGYRSPSGRLGVTSDLVLVKDQDVEAKVGGEFWIWPKHFAVRVGANSANDVGNGLTAGAAFEWNDLAVDYAYVPLGTLGDQNLVSLTYRFGGDRPPIEWEARPTKSAGLSVPRTGSSGESREPNHSAAAAAELVHEREMPPPSIPARRIKPVEQRQMPRTTAVPPASASELAAASPAASRLERQAAARAAEDAIKLGNDLMALGRSDEAIIQYKRAVAIDSENGKAWYNLATAQYLLRDYASARTSYEAAIKINPRDAESHLFLGFSYYRMGMIDGAVHAWQRVLVIDPSNVVALNNLEALRNR